MYFSHLELTHFRNYETLSLDFVDGVNCFTGNNGSGKTNLLEAIHYLSLTRGFQSKADKYTLQEGAPYFFVKAICKLEKEEEVQCNFVPGKGKKIIVNSIPLEKLSQHVGRIPLIAVLPNDTQLIHESSSTRRRFMDSFISQYDEAYLKSLIHYERALKQRNALLSLFVEQGSFDMEQLNLWDDQLIAAGRVVHEKRVEFLDSFQPYFSEYFSVIVSEKEQPEIHFKSVFKENSEEEWRTILAKQLERDRYLQRTTQGTHREDLEFTIDGNAVKNYGSQGQQKTFVISLKLAQYEMLKSNKQLSPILLLDDIFDKLDIHRLSAIANLLESKIEGQVFVTDTSEKRLRNIFSESTQKEIAFYQVADKQVKALQHHGKEE